MGAFQPKQGSLANVSSSSTLVIDDLIFVTDTKEILRKNGANLEAYSRQFTDSSTIPTVFHEGSLWIDLSQNPPTIKRYDGTSWIVLTGAVEKVKPVSILTTAWTINGVTGLYEATISDTDITTSTDIEFRWNLDTIYNVIGPIRIDSESLNGSYKLYANAKPPNTIVGILIYQKVL